MQIFEQRRLTNIGQEIGCGALAELEGHLRREICGYMIPGAENAWAKICGNEIGFDPVWFGSLALDPTVGREGPKIIVAHEVSHVLDCVRRTTAGHEQLADIWSGVLRGQMGYPREAGIGVFRKFVCTVCGPYRQWWQRRNDYLSGWDASQR